MNLMRFRLHAILMLVASMVAFGQDRLPAAKVVEFVKYTVGAKETDKNIAAYLNKVVLTDRLDPQIVEALRRSGAGPKTIDALTRLATASALLPNTAAAPITARKEEAAPASPPPVAEQQRVMNAVVDYARKYIPSLPDFLCLQVTRRSIDNHYVASNPASWTPADRIVEKLSFVDHREKYEILSHNDNAIVTAAESAKYGGDTLNAFGGAVSRGDWASILEAIFDPEAETTFRWERWGNLDQKLYHVYRYQVTQEHSRETLETGNRKVSPAFHGEIFIPVDADVIRRITVEPEPPADFPLQNIREILNYDYVDISGHSFLLPLSSDLVMRNGQVANRNEIQFRRYQKYSADADIKFDDVTDVSPDPAPGPRHNP